MISKQKKRQEESNMAVTNYVNKARLHMEEAQILHGRLIEYLVSH